MSSYAKLLSMKIRVLLMLKDPNYCTAFVEQPFPTSIDSDQPSYRLDH
jgi:hypothetical protein